MAKLKMISYVEPYLEPIAETERPLAAFQRRKLELSIDQQEALEYLINIPENKLNNSISMYPGSGKTKVILYYYQFLVKQGLRVRIRCPRKVEKYAAYAKALNIEHFSRTDCITKYLHSSNVDVLIIDYSNITYRTVNIDRNEAQQMHKINPKLRVIQILSTANPILADNSFIKMQPLNNTTRTAISFQSLKVSGVLGSKQDRTPEQVVSGLYDMWPLPTTPNAPLHVFYMQKSNPNLEETCRSLGVACSSIKNNNIIKIAEECERLIFFLDSSESSSNNGKASIYEHARYVFQRYVHKWKNNQTKSAVLVAPSENAQEMGFGFSFLLSSQELDYINYGRKRARIGLSFYRGWACSGKTSFYTLLEAIYNIQLHGWNRDDFLMSASTYFQIEGREKKVLNMPVSMPPPPRSVSNQLSGQGYGDALFNITLIADIQGTAECYPAGITDAQCERNLLYSCSVTTPEREWHKGSIHSAPDRVAFTAVQKSPILTDFYSKDDFSMATGVEYESNTDYKDSTYSVPLLSEEDPGDYFKWLVEI